MEENEKKQEQQVVSKKEGLIAFGGIFLMGYLLGGVQANKRIMDAYHKGVSDTLERIIFRLEK